MSEIDIRNLLVNFPYDPYDIQKDYMSKVIECLQNKENAVLESPTGTGKTLSLLCSSLAWLCTQMRETQNPDQFLANVQNKPDPQVGSSSGPWGTNSSSRPPKIVYASRTHSQLKQAMLELRKTSYGHLKVGLLGSRDQLCIHPQVSKEPDVATKIHMCKMLLSEKKCKYNLDVEKKINEPIFQEELVDVEDLLQKGKRALCCPYYASRELQKYAQVIFTPYNYLLDPKTRRAQDITLFNDVVILDEAHNIERICEESASAYLNSTTIAVCIAEITTVMKVFSEEMLENLSFEKTAPRDFSVEELAMLKTIFMAVEKAIDDLELRDQSKTFPGSFIFRLLDEADIKSHNWRTLIEMLDRICQFLTTTSESQMHQKAASLTKFGEFIEAVFNSLGPLQQEDYTDLNFKLHVEREDVRQPKGNSWANTKINPGAKVLNFWCFNPGFGMKSLVDQGIHNVILTSGTLSPLGATISEIGIPIRVQLSNPHIIKENQICAVVIDKGPAGTELRCVYQNRSNEKYLADLGQTCLNFYRVIPGGVLVFFPSYPFMKTCIDFWRSNGTWDRMAAIKSILVEPKSKQEMKSIMEEYYNMLNERGASLFAVCRGKISEGLDFADDRARAVIVVGLPYPPFNDPRVILKRQYLDAKTKNTKSSLDGNEWYQLEAVRAVNQAVGRVIRHAGDHGAVIFCDCRFSQPNNVKSLSSWLQSHLIPNATFGQGLKYISNFFRSWKDAPAKIYYDDTSKPFAPGHSKSVAQSDRKMVASSKTSHSSVTEYMKIYGHSIMPDSKKIEYETSGAKRKSILEKLEEDNDHEENAKCCSTTSVVQKLPNSKSDSDFRTVSMSSTHKGTVKKRKIVVTNSNEYKYTNITTPAVSQNNKNFTLKLQQNASPEQMSAFKKAITEYKNTGSDLKFIQETASIMLESGNPVLRALFEDLHHYMRTDEHKARFREFCQTNIAKIHKTDII